MTRGGRRQPLSNSAYRMLKTLQGAGGSAHPEKLLELAGGSWKVLLRTVSALENRGLLRLRPGVVSLTASGFRAAGSSHRFGA